MRVGYVYYGGQFAGVLQEEVAPRKQGAEITGCYTFTYDKNYLRQGVAIAYTLPLQTTPLSSAHLHNAFRNLISEGWLLRLQSQVQKVDEYDYFGLLLANGEDLSGAITVLPTGPVL